MPPLSSSTPSLCARAVVRRYLGAALAAIVVLLLCGPRTSNAEDPKALPAKEEGESKESGKEAREARRRNEERREASVGVFLGHAVFIDPAGAYVFVRPINPELPRKVFYVDRHTRYLFVDHTGERFKRSFDDLVEGQRVAVRYLREATLFIAGEIYLVKEGFESPEVYLQQGIRRRRSRPATSQGKSSQQKASH